MARTKKSKAAVIKPAGAALDLLVKQFSQPLACLRELVQNSIDAGSNHIEVRVEAVPAEKCLKLSVVDTGEGMTEEIIRSQLTRLFSSDKENDLTKVGKFGIGFVSVFALDPVAVVVDTGRQGQHWRVLFHPDRSYDLISLDTTVEGTTVSLYLPEDRFRMDKLIADVEKTLRFWCRHCRVRITVNDKEISEPFTLDQPVAAQYSEPGTRLVVAPASGSDSFFGFYNQGLTLWEGSGGPLPGLTYKIDSRYFEHTLTRDKLIENEDYHKAIRLLQKVAREEYPPLLYRAACQGDDPEVWRRLELLGAVGVPPKDVEKALLFRDFDGKEYSLATLRQSECYHHDQPDALQRAVHQPDKKRLVLCLPARHPGLIWLDQRGLSLQSMTRCWGLCEAMAEHDLTLLEESAKPLASRLQFGKLVAVRWSSPGKWELARQGEAPGPQFLRRLPQPGDPLLINVEHPHFTRLVQLAAWSPPLAAQLLLQHVILQRPEEQRESLARHLAVGILGQLS